MLGTLVNVVGEPHACYCTRRNKIVPSDSWINYLASWSANDVTSHCRERGLRSGQTRHVSLSAHLMPQWWLADLS